MEGAAGSGQDEGEISVTGIQTFSAFSATSPVTAFWTISNVGFNTLEVYSIQSDSTYFVVSGQTLPLDINSGSSRTLQVTFDPQGQTDSDAFEAEITFSSSDLDDPEYIVNVTGTVPNESGGGGGGGGICSISDPAGETGPAHAVLLAVFLFGLWAWRRKRLN